MRASAFGRATACLKACSASGNCFASASESPMLVSTPGSPGAIFSASEQRAA